MTIPSAVSVPTHRHRHGAVPKLMLELLLCVEGLQRQQCEVEAWQLLLQLPPVLVGQHLWMCRDLFTERCKMLQHSVRITYLYWILLWPPLPPTPAPQKNTTPTNPDCLGWMGVKMQVTCPPKFQVSNKCLCNADVGAWKCWWWGERSRAWWNLTKHRNRLVQYCVPICIKCFDSRYRFLFYCCCYFQITGVLGGVAVVGEGSKKYHLKV